MSVRKIKKGPSIPLAKGLTERQAMKAWNQEGYFFQTLKSFRKFIREVQRDEQYKT